MNKSILITSKIIIYASCLFLVPFWVLAYFDPMASMNIASIGLVPAASDQLVGLSNIRGTVGGVRIAIIAMMFLGTYYKRSDLSLAGAITVGAIALGRFLSLVFDGWELISFITAAGEVVMVLSLLYIGGFISKSSQVN